MGEKGEVYFVVSPVLGVVGVVVAVGFGVKVEVDVALGTTADVTAVVGFEGAGICSVS